MSSTVRQAGKIGAAVFASRLLGLVREAVFAHLFGAGMASDAFRAAFKIPNLLRDLFAEGALSTAFVTTFSKTLEKKGDAAAWRLANAVLTFQMLFVGLCVLVGIGAAGWIVDLLAGPLGAETRDLATPLTRVMFPFILLVSVAATFMGLLNAKGRFGLPASASLFFNLGSILSGVGLAWWIDPSFGIRSIFGMAAGVLVGGFLQMAVQIPAAWKMGFRPCWVWDLKDEDFRKVLALLLPAVIGASAVQVNVLVNTRFAAEIGTGAISWLEYAFRLMQFPIGILGVAIATVTLPSVSRHAARDHMDAFRANIAHSIRLAFVATIPAAVGLAVLAEPIIRLIYERGRFEASDTAATAAALQAYSVGLAGYAAIKVIAPTFYALDMAKVPLRISLTGILLNAVLNYCFLRFLGWGHAGLAMGTSLVALLNFSQLLFALRSRLGGIEGRALLSSMFRTLLAAAMMALAVRAWIVWSAPFAQGFSGALLQALGGVGIGIPTFVLSALILRVQELTELLKGIRKRLKKA